MSETTPSQGFNPQDYLYIQPPQPQEAFRYPNTEANYPSWVNPSMVVEGSFGSPTHSVYSPVSGEGAPSATPYPNSVPVHVSPPLPEHTAPLSQYNRSEWANEGLAKAQQLINEAGTFRKQTTTRRGKEVPSPVGQYHAQTATHNARNLLKGFTAEQGYAPEVVSAAQDMLAQNFPTEAAAPPNAVGERFNELRNRAAGTLGRVALRSGNVLAKVPEAVTRAAKFAGKLGTMAVRVALGTINRISGGR
jgi:hypothetical protein